MRIATVLSVALLGATCLADSEHAHAAIQHYQLNIPRQSLDTALKDLAQQTGLQIGRFSGLVDGSAMVGPVQGDQTPEQALQALLSNTGLTYKVVSDTIIAVYNPRATVADAQNDAGAHESSNSKEGTQSTSSWDRFSLAQVAKGQTASNTAVSQTPQSSQPDVLEEVVVTATKRSERLQEVPTSLSVLSADSLKAQGVEGFTGYKTLVPGLSDFSGGAEGHSAVILRGLNTGFLQPSNTVAFYIDDVPFSASSPISFATLLAIDPELVDLDHIEVLKGPQATLYGSSTLGGIIKLVTAKPDLNSVTGSVLAEGTTTDHGGSGYAIQGSMGIPLIPGYLALRLSAFDRDTPGYMSDVATGGEDRGVSRKEGGRVSLRWAPEEGLDIELSAFLQSMRQDGFTNEYASLQTLQPTYGRYDYGSALDASFHTTYQVYNAAINYTVGNLGTLTSSTSYARYRDTETEDYTGFFQALTAAAPAPVPDNAATGIFFGPTMDKFSEEVRFASNRIGQFEWLAGLWATRESVNYLATVSNVIPPSTQPIPGPSGVSIVSVTPSIFKEGAVFGNITYYFTDSLDLTVGTRFSHNTQTVQRIGGGWANSGPTTSGATSGNDFSYLGTLRYRPTPGVNLYARVATAYRPGGPQEQPPPPGLETFKPDSLIDYEIGAKLSSPENAIQANLSVYYMPWRQVQMTFLTPGGFSIIANGNNAVSKGIEFDSQWHPVKRLSLGATLSYNDAKLTSVSSGVAAATGGVSGDPLPFTPQWTASATLDYVVPLNAALSSDWGVTYRYQGSKWSDYPGDPLNTGVKIPAYNVVDLRAGLNWSRYKVELRVANVFNEYGIDAVVNDRVSPDTNPPAWATVIRPRTLTLSFSARY